MREGNYEKIRCELKRYLKMRYDLARLELLEKGSQIIALLAVTALVVILLLVAFVYFSFALVVWMKPLFDSLIPPLCIVGGFFIVLALLALLFRKQWLLNPLIVRLSRILFRTNENRGDV